MEDGVTHSTEDLAKRERKTTPCPKHTSLGLLGWASVFCCLPYPPKHPTFLESIAIELPSSIASTAFTKYQSRASLPSIAYPPSISILFVPIGQSYSPPSLVCPGMCQKIQSQWFAPDRKEGSLTHSFVSNNRHANTTNQDGT